MSINVGKRLGQWLFWIAGVIGLSYMLWNLIFSDHGYLVYQKESVQLEQLKDELSALKLERERLAKEVLRFRDDPRALEELVHRELGYVHPDEYMVIMKDKPAVKGRGK